MLFAATARQLAKACWPEDRITDGMNIHVCKLTSRAIIYAVKQESAVKAAEN